MTTKVLEEGAAEYLGKLGFEVTEGRYEGGVVFTSDRPDDDPIETFTLVVDEGMNLVSLQFLLRSPCPRERKADVALVLSRLNSELALCAFELDDAPVEGQPDIGPDGVGYVRLRLGIDVRLATLAPESLRWPLLTCLDALELHLPTVQVALDGG